MIRHFVEVMYEGRWQRVAVCATRAEAERTEAEVYEETAGRDTRIIVRRSRARTT